MPLQIPLRMAQERLPGQSKNTPLSVSSSNHRADPIGFCRRATDHYPMLKYWRSSWRARVTQSIPPAHWSKRDNGLTKARIRWSTPIYASPTATAWRLLIAPPS